MNIYKESRCTFVALFALLAISFFFTITPAISQEKRTVTGPFGESQFYQPNQCAYWTHKSKSFEEILEFSKLHREVLSVSDWQKVRILKDRQGYHYFSRQFFPSWDSDTLIIDPKVPRGNDIGCIDAVNLVAEFDKSTGAAKSSDQHNADDNIHVTYDRIVKENGIGFAQSIALDVTNSSDLTGMLAVRAKSQRGGAVCEGIVFVEPYRTGVLEMGCFFNAKAGGTYITSVEWDWVNANSIAFGIFKNAHNKYYTLKY